MRSILLALAVGILTTSLPTPISAKPYNPALQAERRCTASAIIIPAVRALAKRLRSNSIQARVVRLTPTAQGVHIEADALGLDAPSKAPSAMACANGESKYTLAANAGQVPTQYLRAVAAVEDFRASSLRRGSRADDTQASEDVTTVFYETRYILVFIGDNVRYTENGAVVFGCLGEEYFRFDTVTSQVLQFDGCLEGRTPALPRFSDLPD